RIAFLYDWDFNRAGFEYRRARELQPGLVHQWYASYLLILNKPVEAEEENRKFSEVLPFAPGLYFPQYYFWVRRYDRAAEMMQKRLEGDSGLVPAHEMLGSVYEQQGRNADALAELQKAQQLSGSHAAAGALGHLYASTGKTADAVAMLQALDRASGHQDVSPVSQTPVLARLGPRNPS